VSALIEKIGIQKNILQGEYLLFFHNTMINFFRLYNSLLAKEDRVLHSIFYTQSYDKRKERKGIVSRKFDTLLLVLLDS
jgi:hypothetical protein